jgi:dephospho-CoA kinase
MYIVGLTGGIGSGKSTVAQCFKDLNIDVIDADQIARDVVKPGSIAFNQVVNHFGSEAVQRDGELNRSFIRKQIFADLQKKNWLETLLHPLIHAEAHRQIHLSKDPYCLYMAPLLIENKLQSMVHRVLVVDVDPELQLHRAATRDKSHQEEIKKIIDSQIARQTRLDFADDIIDNSGDLGSLKQQVAALHRIYCELAHDN